MDAGLPKPCPFRTGPSTGRRWCFVLIPCKISGKPLRPRSPVRTIGFSSSPEQRGDSGSGNTPPGPGGGLPADAAGLPVDGPPEESGFRALRCGNLSRTARSSGSVSMHSGKHRPAFTSIPPCQAASPSSSPWPRKRGSVPDWNAWGPISGAAGSIRYVIASTAIKWILYSRRGKGRRKRWGDLSRVFPGPPVASGWYPWVISGLMFSVVG